MGTKICTICKSEKALDNFYKQPTGKYGVQSQCKLCMLEYQNKYHSLDFVKLKRKNDAKKYYENNRNKINKRNNNWNKNNKDKIKITVKRWRLNNIDRLKELSKINYKNNKNNILNSGNIYRKKRMSIDPIYKLKIIIRNRIRQSFKSIKSNKRNTAQQIIGTTFEIAKAHIERQFTKGMKWSNHGYGVDKWHIDHIIPLSSANTEEEIKNLCHYTNLQPLWQKENLRKSDKIISTQMKIIL